MQAKISTITLFLAMAAGGLAAPMPASEVAGAVPVAETLQNPVANTVQDAAPEHGKRNSDEYHGDMTYYQVGQGACGQDDSGKDDTANIVAISPSHMGDDVSSPEMCGRKISIQGPKGTITATVRDKCPSCGSGQIDVSQKVFKEVVGNLGVGRAPISWSFV